MAVTTSVSVVVAMVVTASHAAMVAVSTHPAAVVVSAAMVHAAVMFRRIGYRLHLRRGRAGDERQRGRPGQ
jgi:hypothetical protein